MPKKTNSSQEYQAPFSILNMDGTCEEAYLKILPDKDLVTILKTMILNTVLEKQLLLLQRQGRIKFSITSTGEEGAIIGATYALNPTDPMFLTYRETGTPLFRGVKPETIINQYMGNKADLNKGRQMPVHHGYKDQHIISVSSPVGTQLPQACGYGYAAKLKKTGQVAFSFLGEGTASADDFHAALNFSGVLESPVIFLIRNNGYAISTPESLQTAAPSLALRAKGYGIQGVQIDGNDTLAVIHAVSEAAKLARTENKPTLIEAMTYRLGAHSTSDDPSGYRDNEEAKEWETFHPFKRLSTHAKWREVWTDVDEKNETEKCTELVKKATEKCEKIAPPAIETLFDEVYEKTTENLLSQKQELLDFLKYQPQKKG